MDLVVIRFGDLRLKNNEIVYSGRLTASITRNRHLQVNLQKMSGKSFGMQNRGPFYTGLTV